MFRVDEPRVLHELTLKKMAEDAESDITIRFDQSGVSEMEIKKESPFLSCIELTVQQGNPYHTEYSLRIIYNLQFEESNFWFDIYSFISLLLFNKITLSVLLALLYKRPVSIDPRRNFSFH